MKAFSQSPIKATLALIAVLSMTLCIACSPKGDSEGTSDADAKTQVSGAPWSTSTDCSVCHSAQSSSFEDPALSASFHAASTCFDCHADEAALTKVHENADAPPTKPSRNSYTMASQDTCITNACHISYEELAALTADSKALVDIEGVVINPHAVPASSGHLIDSKECYNCHTIHTKKPPDGQYCRDCHHTNYFSSCSQCHD